MNKKIVFNQKYLNQNLYPSIDKIKDKIQSSYKNLKIKKNNIILNEFIFSKSDEEFNKNEFESFKNDLIKNTNENNSEKNKEFSFPFINTKNYNNISEFPNGIKSINIETTKILMKKLRKKLDYKLAKLNLNKKVIPKNPNLSSYKSISSKSLISFKNYETENNNKQIENSFKNNYRIPNQFFSHKLSYSLNQVLIKAKEEEDFSSEQGLKMLEDLKGIHYFHLSRNENRNKSIKNVINLKKNIKDSSSNLNYKDNFLTEIIKPQKVFSNKKYKTFFGKKSISQK